MGNDWCGVKGMGDHIQEWANCKQVSWAYALYALRHCMTVLQQLSLGFLT